MKMLKRILRPNFKLCYTQAGFKKALKHYFGDRDYYMDQLQGHPTSYPSLVSFSDGYQGYHFPRASCIHLNKIKE